MDRITEMDTGIMVESLPLLGVCNMCMKDGAVKSMLIKHNLGSTTESYTDMLFKCFSIDVSLTELDDTKKLICDACIIKLRDSLHFREMVETSLKTLEAAVQLQKAQMLDLKEESNDMDQGFDDNDSDDEFRVKDEFTTDVVESTNETDAILNGILIKSEPDEYRPRRRKKKTLSTSKKKSYSIKKMVDISETEMMLASGLFPFKIGKNRTFSCAVCPEKSSDLDDIKAHISDHSLANIHVAFKKMITSNLQRFYKSTTNLRCKICVSDVSNYDELKQHIDNCARLNTSCFNKLPFKLEKDQLDCPICKKKFLNFVSLNTHMNEHYPNHVCDSCGKAFASKARLRGHMRTHEVGDFPCRYCDAVFDKVTKRENHVSKEHKSGIRYACKRCNISLSSFYARQKHLAEVHNEELKRYKCKACTQSYITPGHLSSHVRRDHLNERNHKCDKCDLAFYTKNSLKMHMIKHDGERIHSCHICQKSYQRKKTLREHMRIHNNDKRFVCPVCGRAFTQKCTLKGHLRVHERKVEVDDRIPQPLHSI